MKERALFLAFALLNLAPFWTVSWVPTTDGPCHVYNSYLQLHLDDPALPQIGRAFTLDRRPLPNWIGQAVLAGLLHIFDPATAEKLLVSGYALLFLGAARFFAGAIEPERRWLSWLAVPFVYTWAFHFGFYSFSFSLALYLLAVGVWWRRRERPGPGLAALLTPLLLACYFAHIVGAILALLSIAVLWLATLGAARRAGALRRHLLHVPILLPQAVLPLWFLAVQRGEPVKGSAVFTLLWRDFWELRSLFSYSGRWPGVVLALLFLLLALLTVRSRLAATDRGPRPRWREEDGFLLLAGVLTVLYFASPDGMSGGSLLRPRLSLVPFLVLIPWLAPPPQRWVRPALIGGLALLSAWNLAAVAGAYRGLDREAREFLAASGGIEPGTRVLPMLANGRSEVAGPVMLTHVFDRVALTKGLVDWSDYEAAMGYFPIRFAPSVRRPPMRQIIDAPLRVDVESFAPEIDYVYAWKLLPGSGAERRLAGCFVKVAQHGFASLYERRDRVLARGDPVVRQ